jgi:fibronectin type 3 domain-containing protein
VAGQLYYYVVTAVDSSGVESVYSNQASATVPTP